MEFAVKPIHDFLAFLVSLATGVLTSFTQPLLVSLCVFLLCLSIWFLATSQLVRAEYRAALDPRVSRAATGGILLLVSTLMLTSHTGLDARYKALLIILVVAALAIYVYYLSRRPP